MIPYLCIYEEDKNSYSRRSYERMVAYKERLCGDDTRDWQDEIRSGYFSETIGKDISNSTESEPSIKN